MSKKIILIIIIIAVIGVGYWAYQSLTLPNTTGPAASADATTPAISKEEAIKELFANEQGKDISEVTIAITQETDNYARGGVSFYPGGSENSGMFLAAKVDGKWQLIHSGQGAYACSMVEQYNFPPEMIQDCY